MEHRLKRQSFRQFLRKSGPAADSGTLYPRVIALSALMLGFTAAAAPVTAIFGTISAGALLVLRRRRLALLTALAMLPALLVLREARVSVGYWMLFMFMAGAGLISLRSAPAFLSVPRWVWSLCILSGTASICTALLASGLPASLAVIVGCVCAGWIGAGLARHLAMVDGRILAWGDDGLTGVTRDLLLGRVTSGMLHDLSQPLNVIAMANGNLGYIIEHLDIDAESKVQLQERIARISNHTEGAAYILRLFRWFGREENQEEAKLHVRSALERAVATTKSNVRHPGITVEMQGNALDYLVPDHHGRLEMIAVAALLSSFGAYIDADGTKRKGTVVLDASLSSAHVVVKVLCKDEAGGEVAGQGFDHATLWLVEQLAHDVGGDFRCQPRGAKPSQFRIRLARTTG